MADMALRRIVFVWHDKRQKPLCLLRVLTSFTVDSPGHLLGTHVCVFVRTCVCACFSLPQPSAPQLVGMAGHVWLQIPATALACNSLVPTARTVCLCEEERCDTPGVVHFSHAFLTAYERTLTARTYIFTHY